MNDGRPANPIVHGEENREKREIIREGQPAPGTKRHLYALRLGFRQVKGLGKEEMQVLVEMRGNGYRDPTALWRRAGLPESTLATLARADAFRSMTLDRRQALWAVKGLPEAPLPLFAASMAEEQGEEEAVTLPALTQGEHVAEDYLHTQLSIKRHPMGLLRDIMASQGYQPCASLQTLDNGSKVRVAGIVLVRQRPGTASGVIFSTLEDETGIANIVIWPKIFECYRRVVLGSSLLGVVGKLQREGLVTHLIADHMVDLTQHLRDMARADLPSADEIEKPDRDAHNRQLAERAHQRRDPVYRSRDFH